MKPLVSVRDSAARRVAAGLLLWAAAAPWVPATAQGTAPGAASVHAQVAQRVQRHVEEQTANLPGKVQIAVTAPDERIRLADCESMQVFLPGGARLWGQTSVGVRCLAPQPWQIFVPVSVRVQAAVVISTRPLAAGAAITPADLATRTEELTLLPGSVLLDPAQAIGRTLAAGVPGGGVLRAEQFRQAWAVTQGQVVRVVYESSSLSVSAEGKALANAAAGQPVDVRMSSGKTVRGIAQAAGVVTVQ